MNMVILKSLVMVLAGVFLLRIAGRKSISQMSLAQTVIMISIGSIIIQPIIETSIVRTLIASAVFIFALMVMEELQIKSNKMEKFLTGKSRIVIKNGIIQEDQLRKLRLSVDQLEMFIRQQGITHFSDIKTVTIEPNGQMGYELQEDAKPLTIGEFKKLVHPSMLKQPSAFSSQTNQPYPQNIFQEIQSNKEENPGKPLQ
ncbi:DUF421 domain-containing protein [Pontibacillus sp. HMF3514]|nr:YetF domain-containing protein [Pontibacillus sp. HMF3514]QHE50596.1 DUF421 domain-containing protein [Pontibacillus sp. HMF3514]